ncbi:hypothetical protein ACFPYI_02720 [Halomarina salina]|uniref:DUF7308 domain-containing protein n=1 Tax=Halomarina salina TaxID=1872699 RepID=A0ABD5RIE7_9EURY|nr:hypothetical protein [Halomarina salina]
MGLGDISVLWTGRDRGISSTIGVILILGIVLIGTTSIVAFGSIALEDTQRQSTLERAEQTMAQFDSRAAQVALGGEETTQRLSMGQAEGNYQVLPNNGKITITHVDYNDADDDEVIYSEPLGAVVYENGDTTLSYQGGGVWRTDGGNTQMVSPPEFHYRGSTLTLPVIRVFGSDSAAGSPTAVLKKQSMKPIYPLSGKHYGDDTAEYLNPASNGQIQITIESPYYRGWAEYFDARTETNVVTIDDANQQVTVDLITLGPQGQFNIPTKEDPLQVQGMTPGSMSDLSLTVRPEASRPQKLSSLDWSLYIDRNGRQFEVNVNGLSNGECSDSQAADISVYYSDDDGVSYHGWKAEDAIPVTCNVTTNNPELKINLMDSGIDMTYDDLSGNLAENNPNGQTKNSVSFDHFDTDPMETYNRSDLEKENLDVVIRHYLNHFAPNFQIESNAGNSGNNVGIGTSEGDDIQYDGDTVITFLHVSENNVEVELE